MVSFVFDFPFVAGCCGLLLYHKTHCLFVNVFFCVYVFYISSFISTYGLFTSIKPYDMMLWDVYIYFMIDTEIDWEAYMSEVSGFLEGERNYLNLKGATGPLVYPAGFVYLYSALYYITDHGTDILLAQYIFMGFYLMLLMLVFMVYVKSSSFPPLLFPLLCLSKRVHSIFMLRMFNDGIAILLFYLALLLFIQKFWKSGCVFFSLAVSIKMNILLFAPGLLLLLLLHHSLWQTIGCLCICAIVQLVLGLPFLTTFPLSYLQKAFEFSRVFFYKWTVNWKFLSEEVSHTCVFAMHVSMCFF